MNNDGIIIKPVLMIDDVDLVKAAYGFAFIKYMSKEELLNEPPLKDKP